MITGYSANDSDLGRDFGGFGLKFELLQSVIAPVTPGTPIGLRKPRSLRKFTNYANAEVGPPPENRAIL